MFLDFLSRGMLSNLCRGNQRDWEERTISQILLVFIAGVQKVHNLLQPLQASLECKDKDLK